LLELFFSRIGTQWALVLPHKILHFESRSTVTHQPATRKTCVCLIVADWTKYHERPVKFSIWPVTEHSLWFGRRVFFTIMQLKGPHFVLNRLCGIIKNVRVLSQQGKYYCTGLLNPLPSPVKKNLFL